MKFTHNNIRGLLSVIIIAIFMLVTASIMLHPLIVGDLDEVQNKILAERLNMYLSGFTGIIGVILGYYFGKKSSNED